MQKNVIPAIFSFTGVGISFCLCSVIAFAAQIAFTKDGKEVILDDNRTWRYLSDDAEIFEVKKVDQQLREDLRSYIDTKDPDFMDKFGVDVNWDEPTYELKYISLMERLYYSHRRLKPEKFYDELLGIFPKGVADNIIWVFERWSKWTKYCRQAYLEHRDH